MSPLRAAAVLAALAPCAADFMAVGARGERISVPTNKKLFEAHEVRTRALPYRADGPGYNVNVTDFLSPPITLMTGEAWFSLPDVTRFPLPKPGAAYALLSAQFDIVEMINGPDGQQWGRSVPLNEMYSHHWLVYDTLTGGTGRDLGCGGEHTFVSNVEGAGGEMRGIHYVYPDGYGYVSPTGIIYWTANIHFIRTQDLSTDHFNGSIGAATKSCIECEYVLGKAPECVPFLDGPGVFACCFDGCRCPVNNRKDRSMKTYYIQYNVTWTTDLAKIKPIQQYVIDATHCDILENLGPNKKRTSKGTVCGPTMCTVTGEEKMDQDATILWGYTHQHIGAINSTLYVNGKEVCTSVPRTGTDPANAPGNEKGYVVAFDLCIDASVGKGYHVKKGDKLKIVSRYSVDPNDKRSAPIGDGTGTRTGTMSLFFFYVSPDAELYTCHNGQCIQSPTGKPKAQVCNAECTVPVPQPPAPPAPQPPIGALYRCEFGVCEPARSGVDFDTCQAAC